MDKDKAYFIEDIKIRVVGKTQIYNYVVEPEHVPHPWKANEWIEPIKLEVKSLPIRTITVNNGKGKYENISFYCNTEIDKFLGTPFNTIENQERLIEILQKQVIKLTNQIDQEQKEANEVILKLESLNNKLLPKPFWQKVKDLFQGDKE